MTLGNVFLSCSEPGHFLKGSYFFPAGALCAPARLFPFSPRPSRLASPCRPPLSPWWAGCARLGVLVRGTTRVLVSLLLSSRSSCPRLRLSSRLAALAALSCRPSSPRWAGCARLGVLVRVTLGSHCSVVISEGLAVQQLGWLKPLRCKTCQAK